MAKKRTDPSRVDKKGRTIIPQPVREALELEDGGFVTYEVEGDSVRVRKVEWVAK